MNAKLLLLLLCTAAIAAGADDLTERARRAWERGDGAEALKLADQAVSVEPKEARRYLFRGALLDVMGKLEQAVTDYSKAIELKPDLPSAWQRRGSAHFRLAKVAESLRDFDKYLELEPAEAPQHWQRGIALYYAGKYAEGAKQFELHQTVNTNDVENAAWHYLCVAKAEGIEKAKTKLIPINGDARVPLMKAHALYAGKASPEDVLAEAAKGNPDEKQLNERLFYGHLYIGLWYEAAGKSDEALRHIRLAAEKHTVEGYMGDVAQVHVKLAERREKK